MEYIYRVFLIFVLKFQIQSVVCQSQEVIFEIKDGELNQVLFIGENNITMICHVSNTLHADVTINTPEGLSVAKNGAVGNCVEHTISEITEQSDGNYSCIARYKDENTGQIVEKSKLLSLNVRQISRSVCFRNGSVPTEEYTEGDTLLLSCYCINNLGCFWTQTVVGSERGDRVQPKFTYQHNNKILLQIVVGPLNSTDESLRYDCVHGSQSDQRCSIGPANVSINDTILQAIPTSDHSEGCPTMVTPITGTIPEAMMSSTTDKMEGSDYSVSDKMKNIDSSTSDVIKSTISYQDQEEKEEKGKAEVPLYILIIAAVLLMLLFVSVLLFILLVRKNKRKKTGQHNDENQDEKENTNPRAEADNAVNISTTYAQPVQNGHVKSVSNVINIDVDHAYDDDDGEEVCVPEVVEYKIPVAFRKEAYDENDDVNEGEEFCIPAQISEYDIPVAFRRDAAGEEARERAESKHGLQSIIF